MENKYKLLLEKAFVSIDKRALMYATIAHEGEFRHDNITPYITHPIRVANLITKYKKNAKEIKILRAAAYLHDTLENTSVTYYDLVRVFGSQVASIVLELTTDEDLKKEIGKSRYLEIKMKNMTNWALDLKLCDRLDNLYDTENSTPSFIDRYTKESVEIITYLINNRTLTKTHTAILNDMIIRLFDLNPLDSDKNAILANLSARLSDLKLSQQEYATYLARLKK